MKNRFEVSKTVQLILFIAVTVVGLWDIFSDNALYQMVGQNISVRMLCILLWVALALSFIFILLDFNLISSLKKDYRELDYTVYNDHIAGIANRYSCDAMIEKYMDKQLPDSLGCVMLDISNIREINNSLGHAGGNAAIQTFSDILHTASLDLCFVGRNGGNKFMALFEDCTGEKIDMFLSRVSKKVDTQNRLSSGIQLKYRTGRAFSSEEHVHTVTELISLSDRRLTPGSDSMTDALSRTSCDDIISVYLDKPLPPQIGCMMLDIADIRDINDRYGHIAGNRMIRSLSDILRDSSKDLCFVGRNGGAKFIALFEDCSDEKLDTFTERVREGCADLNNTSDIKLHCRAARAFNEGPDIKDINRLIALSDKRLRDEPVLF